MKIINLTNSIEFPECFVEPPIYCSSNRRINFKGLEENIHKFWKNSYISFANPQKISPSEIDELLETDDIKSYGNKISNDILFMSYLNFVLSNVPIFLVNTSLISHKILIKDLNNQVYADTIVPKDEIKKPVITSQDIFGLNEDLHKIQDKWNDYYVLKLDDILKLIIKERTAYVELSNKNKKIINDVLFDLIKIRLCEIAYTSDSLIINKIEESLIITSSEKYHLDLRINDDSIKQMIFDIIHEIKKAMENDHFFRHEIEEYCACREDKEYKKKNRTSEPFIIENSDSDDESIQSVEGLYCPFGGDNREFSKPEIFIWLDKIKSIYNYHDILSYVIAHEFAHAMMDENLWKVFLNKYGIKPTGIKHNTKTYICNEEALATAIGWHITGQNQIISKHILSCPHEYQLGLSDKYIDKKKLQKQCIPLWIEKKLTL